jgi:hypothetical protein
MKIGYLSFRQAAKFLCCAAYQMGFLSFRGGKALKIPKNIKLLLKNLTATKKMLPHPNFIVLKFIRNSIGMIRAKPT